MFLGVINSHRDMLILLACMGVGALLGLVWYCWQKSRVRYIVLEETEKLAQSIQQSAVEMEATVRRVMLNAACVMDPSHLAVVFGSLSPGFAELFSVRFDSTRLRWSLVREEEE